MDVVIKEIDWDQIYEVWTKNLWPNRLDPIEPTSALDILGNINMDFMDNVPVFLGAFYGSILIGVNSLHLAGTASFRSRGLYVFPEYRGRGVSTKLLKATCDYAKSQGALTVWSIPRETSFKAYQSVGFVQCSHWLKQGFPDGPNCYAIVVL